MFSVIVLVRFVSIICLGLLLGSLSGCQQESQEENRVEVIWGSSDTPQPIPGRAVRPDVVEFVVYPERFDGKRIVLEGVWRSGFESSSFQVDNSEQRFLIWTEWLAEPTRREEPQWAEEIEAVLRLSAETRWSTAVRVVAEGSFFYDKRAGFGHMGASQAVFLMDRIYEISPARADESGAP